MILSQKLFEAINLATRLHRTQTRHDEEHTPYISHLYAVMHILSHVTDDEDTLIGGLFHDSLEDVAGYTKEKLLADMGETVTSYVLGVTEMLDPNKAEDEQIPWITRKEAYIQNLKNAPRESVMISHADKIHNLMCVQHALEHNEDDDTITKRMRGNLSNYLFFYNGVHIIGKERLGEDHILVTELRERIDTLTKLFI